MQPDKHDGVNTLMMTPILRTLPAAKHNAYVCSAGSKGYCALKETLQNGMPGHTLLIESKDLRDVRESSGRQCCLVYINVNERKYNDHISPTVTHVTVYGNVTSTPLRFLEGCTGLASVDLSPLTQITEVLEGFLWECTGLNSVDLSPLSQVTGIHEGFLFGCTGLKSVDLSPLSQATEVLRFFLAGCIGLTTVDLRPLSRVAEVHGGFLFGCAGLTSVDLSPLSQATVVLGDFLWGCTGLASIDLSAPRVTFVHEGFLEGCTQITTIHNIPPLCTNPPPGWLLKDTNQWVRE